MQHLNVVALKTEETLKKRTSKHAQCKYCQWNANASKKIVVGLFFPCLSTFAHVVREKNVFRCRKTYERKKKPPPYFPFKILVDKFTIIVSVKDVRKDLSSFQAVKSCPRCWCLWLFYFPKYWMGFAERKLRQIEGSKKEHDSRVYCSKHSPIQRKDRRKMLYTCLFHRISMPSTTNITRLKLGVNTT